MNVNFYATLRQVTGRKTDAFDLPAKTTVHALLEAVVERYPAMRDELFRDDGELYPHVHVFVNGRDAPYLDGALDAELSEDDLVDVFPAVAGG